MKTRRLLLAVVLVGVVAACGWADVVTLSDGSRLVGVFGRLDGDKLIIETLFAGTLEIDATHVVRIETEGPKFVEMSSGDRLVGRIEWQPAADTAVVQTEMGGVPIKVDNVVAVWGPDDKSPEQMRHEAEMEAKRPRWAFEAEIGATKKTGNTETMDFHGRLELRRKTDKDLLKFFVTGVYGEEDDLRNTAEVIGGAEYEYLFTDRAFAYARNTYEYDEFENIQLRVVLAAGGGYYFIKEEDHELKVRGGGGLRHESYLEDANGNTAPSQTDPIADLGLNYRLDIKPWLRFTHSTGYTPSLEEFGDYRLEFDTAFVVPLGADDRWKWKLGVRNDYDSRPAPGIERLDTLYYTNVQVTLE